MKKGIKIIKGEGKLKWLKGFSLIEMVVVISIMSILALIIVPNLTSYLGVADSSKIESNLKNLYTSAEIIHKTERKLDKGLIEQYSNMIPVNIGDPSEEVYTVNVYNGKVVASYINREGVLFKHPKDAEFALGDTGDYESTDPGEGSGGDDGGSGGDDGGSGGDGSVVEVPKEPTDSKYFTFNPSTKTITKYSTAGPKDVVIPSHIDGVPVLEIGVSAFLRMGINSVEFPETLVELEVNSFAGNNIQTVVIPDTVLYIRTGAFNENAITKVTIGDSVQRIDKRAFYKNYLTEVTIPNSIVWIVTESFAMNGPNQNSEEIKVHEPGHYVLNGTVWEK